MKENCKDLTVLCFLSGCLASTEHFIFEKNEKMKKVVGGGISFFLCLIHEKLTTSTPPPYFQLLKNKGVVYALMREIAIETLK